MKLRVLGCSGSDMPGRHVTSFLVNGSILLDAGTVTSALELEEQKRITDILITHAHLDHIKDIPFLADNLIECFLERKRPPVILRALPEVLQSIGDHILNGVIWPDFTAIPASSPVLAHRPVEPKTPFKLGGLNVAACPVDHATCAAGYVLWSDDGAETLAYTGDTGGNGQMWAFINSLPVRINNLITEAGFPNAMEDLAVASRHMTPRLLRKQLERLEYKPNIYIYHLKASFSEQIQEELRKDLAGYNCHLLREKESLDFHVPRI